MAEDAICEYDGNFGFRRSYVLGKDSRKRGKGAYLYRRGARGLKARCELSTILEIKILQLSIDVEKDETVTG